MKKVLNWTPNKDYTNKTTRSDILGVNNENVEVASQSDIVATLHINGLTQQDPGEHVWELGLLLDNVIYVPFPELCLRNSNITDRVNVSMALSKNLAAGTYSCRVVWRKVSGPGFLNVDEKTKLTLVLED